MNITLLRAGLAILAVASFLQMDLRAADRQRIGLVFEGGGALGFAHIGVLKWLEDNHIPVDAVAGTSMGGLVGGLYAAGKSPAEIQKLVEEIDWDTVLRGQTRFQDLAFRRKEDRLAYPNRFDFGVRGKTLGGPSGLNSGQEVDVIIDRALLPYFDVATFDDLPIPFRCVATEMVSGRQKVFDRGSLAVALRATMSIPAVFAPVSSGGEVYTDGGALNNLPVDVARAMNVDIVIAVMLDTGPVDPKSLNSALGVAGRAVSVMISANEMRSIQMADILLTADLKGYSAADFKKSEEILPTGFEAANRKKALLSNLALPAPAWDAHIAARAAKRRVEVPQPEFIRAAGTSQQGERAIQAALAKDLNKPLDPDSLENSLNILNGRGAFSSLRYGLTRENGHTGLMIDATEKSYGPPFLNLGVNIDGTDPNDVRFGIGLRLTFHDIGGYGSEWRTDASFGTFYGINTEYYRRFSQNSGWFLAGRGYSRKSRFDVYHDSTRTAQYEIVRNGVGVDLGYRLGRRWELRIGEDFARANAALKIGQGVAPNGSITNSDSSVRFQYLGQDDVFLPRNGLIQSSRFDWFTKHSGGGAYPSAQTQFNYFRSTGEKGSVIVGAQGGSAFGTKNLRLDSFSLGGPFKMGAYGINELLGNQYFLLQGGYSYRLTQLNPLIGEAVYVIGVYEVGKVYGNPAVPKLPQDGSVALLAKTAIGPVFVGGSAGGGRAKWWFGLGRIF